MKIGPLRSLWVIIEEFNQKKKSELYEAWRKYCIIIIAVINISHQFPFFFDNGPSWDDNVIFMTISICHQTLSYLAIHFCEKLW